MQNFMKTILSAVQTWTKGKIKDSTADWNQNDSSADDYVKNRTHWEEEREIVLVDNLTSSDYQNNNVPECNFVPGQKYDVVWNGTLYEGLVCRFDGDYNVITSPDDGCPFYIDDDGGNALYVGPVDSEEEFTVSIFTIEKVIHKLDNKYLPANLATTDDVESAMGVASAAQTAADNAQTAADGKMDATNPVGTGSFSMNRKADTVVGTGSHAEGYNTTASGGYSHAEGYNTTASGDYSHAEGYNTTASGTDSHAEGYNTTASGTGSHAEGYFTTASGKNSHAEGYNTIASHISQHVQGEYNILDSSTNYAYERGKYAHIVGNGTSTTARSNAHTLDWNGVGWYQGGLQVGGNAQDDGAKNVLLEGDAIPVPETATVGQAVVVKSVDENGKPTEWEPMTLATETWTFQMADGTVVTKEVYVKS